MPVLHGYRVAANWFAGVLGVISAFLIFPTVIISVVNVVLRRVGANQGRNLTSNSLVEAQWYLYTLIFVFGLAHILRDSINVRVDFWFGNRSSETQSWIDLVGHFIGLLPFAYIGIKYSWPAVQPVVEVPGGLTERRRAPAVPDQDRPDAGLRVPDDPGRRRGDQEHRVPPRSRVPTRVRQSGARRRPDVLRRRVRRSTSRCEAVTGGVSDERRGT